MVGFLKDGYKIRSALVQILVFIDIHWINFQSDGREILLRNLYRISDIFHAGCRTAFACQQQHFSHIGLCDRLHFLFDFFHVQMAAVNLVLTVKSAINTLILTIIGDIKRCKQLYAVAEMLFPFSLCLFCHLFQKWLCCRRKQSCELLHGASCASQGSLHLFCCVSCLFKCLHGSLNFFKHLRIQLLHVRLVGHRVVNGTQMKLPP